MVYAIDTRAPLTSAANVTGLAPAALVRAKFTRERWMVSPPTPTRW
jgi:hypothetical protein